MNRRITILLGAGASSPFIRATNEAGGDEALTTNLLTRVLFESNRWDTILAAYHRYGNCKAPPEEIAGSAEIVRKTLLIRNLLGSGARKWPANFESILHLMDGLGGYLGSYRETRHTDIDEILITIGRLLQARSACLRRPFRLLPAYRPKEDWSQVPALAREVLATAIKELWEKCDRQKAITTYRRFFYNLAEPARVSIYSLNYDPLLLESMGEPPCFRTGFAEDGSFDPSGTGFFGARHVLGFLHGHIGLYRQDRVFLTRCYEQAQGRRLRNDNGVGLGTKGRHFNTYLITGLDKIEGFDHEPFCAYLHRLALDLGESTDVIMIGYSLVDHHLNAFLANSLNLGVQRITYVTYKDPQEPISWGDWLDLLSLFGDRAPEFDTRYKKKLSASIGDTGYGQLSDHVWLYTGGTEEFLKQEPPFHPVWSL